VLCGEHISRHRVSSGTGPLSVQTPAVGDLILRDEGKRKQRVTKTDPKKKTASARGLKK
jgi:hypothetical protein